MHRCTQTVAAGVLAAAALLAGLAGGTAAQQRASGGDPTASPGPVRVTASLSDVPLRRALHRVEDAGGLRLAYSPDLLPMERRVSVDVEGATGREALRRLTDGLGVEVRRVGRRQFVLRPAPADGVVAGRVTEARDGAPVPGAAVRIADSGRGVLTGEAGRFTIDGVRPGRHTLEVTAGGFRRARRGVEVPEGDTAEVRVELEVARMEEIVVTGTRTRTARSRLTSPVSVMDAEEIRRRDASTVTDLFEGNTLPGVVSLDAGADSEFNQRILIRGVSSPFAEQSPCIKVLVDGRETQMRALGAVGASNVRRVEVIRGPQASTLYGADASCGVVQLFTRDGSELDDERITAEVGFTATESPYVDGTPTGQSVRFDVAGPLGGGSYSLAAGYADRDGFVPNDGSDRRNASFSFRRSVADEVDLKASARFLERDFGHPGSAGIWFDLFRDDVLPRRISVDRNDAHEFRVLNLGVTADWSPTGWWSHRLTAGGDFNRVHTRRPPAAGTDSVTVVADTHRESPTLRYVTTLSPDPSGPVDPTFVAGVDWTSRDFERTRSDFVETDGTRQPTRSGIVETSGHTESAVFGQLQVGLGERLTATMGARADHHGNFGEQYGDWSVNPRVGVAYVVDLGGGAMLKPRASWGTGISAPPTFARDGVPPSILPNPSIAPERTEGWEVGADADLAGGDVHAEATYYRQTTENAIVEEVVSFPAPFRLENTGTVSNDGAEMMVEWFPGLFRASAVFNWMDNEVVDLPEDDRTANREGAPVASPVVPRTSGRLDLSYRAGRLIGRARPGDARLGLGVGYTGHRWALDWRQLWAARRRGSPTLDLTGFARWFDGFAKVNGSASYRLEERFTVNVRVDNIFGSLAEPTPTFVVPGRSVEVRLRARF